MYSVTEVSKLIGVSRQSIYKKIYKEGLQEYLIDSDKGKEVTHEGFELLKKLFNEYLESKPEGVNLQSGNSKATDTLQDKLTADYIDNLKTDTEFFKSQLSEKDNQIQTLSRLLENTQILLKQEQEKNKLMLESTEMKKQKKSGLFLKEIRVFSLIFIKLIYE